MFLKPRVKAFVETVMLEVVLQIAHRPVDHGDGIGLPLPADLLRPPQPGNPRGIQRAALDPLTAEHVAKPHAVRHLLSLRIGCDGQNLIPQCRRNHLIGIGIVHPRMSELDVLYRPVLITGPAIVRSLIEPAPQILHDSLGPIGTDRVEDNDVVRPGKTAQTAREVGLFVQGLYKDGDRHLSGPHNIRHIDHVHLPCAVHR